MWDFEIKRRGNALLVRCAGQLTIEVAGRIKRDLDACFNEGGFSVLAMDLSQVRYLDSSGIGLLVALHSRTLSRDLAFRLLAPSEEVGKTLNLVKLLDFFKYVGSVEDLDLLVD